MLSLTAAFWIMIGIFAFVGMMRGWTKEVLVTSASILGLFTINQFMSSFFGFLNWNSPGDLPRNAQLWTFTTMSVFLLSLAFFGYQSPALASSRLGDRLTRQDNLRDKLLGLLMGGINGWLVIGSIWSFLEYRLVAANDWVRFPPHIAYPFNTTHIVRPLPEVATIIDNLPIPFLTQSPFILPLLLFVVFLFILVVLV